MYSEAAVKNSLGRSVCRKFCIAFLVNVLFFNSCSRKDEKVHVSVLPEVINAELHFRGYVTDEEEELVSQIYNFSRRVTRTDTINGKPVFAHVSNNQESYFYTDDDGTVWEFNATDIGARVAKYGFSYREPVILRRWEMLLRIDDGVGTEWQVNTDTTFDAITMDGQVQKIRYIKQGKAQYEGWTETYLPEAYANVPVLEANWLTLNTYIINDATGDTLFATEGRAHQYFKPGVGAVKYITNFSMKELDEPEVARLGTWELVRKEIPE